MSKAILIIGATGKQGGSVIDAILASSDASNFTLLGVTRNAESGSAQKLQKRGVKIVQGDLNDIPALYAKAKEIRGGSIWGVFCMLTAQGRGASPETEEAQGKALVDGALENGVEYFVYASVDRGGDERSWENPTKVPHFISKHKVELHLREKAGDKMKWSILRPTAFMDNWSPGFFGKLFTTTWRLNNPDKPLQLIAVKDIGIFAAKCFSSPETWNHKAVALAGSDITIDQANQIFKEKTGTEKMPETFGLLSRGMTWALADVRLMFEWFVEEGYGANIEELKKIHPGLMTWDEWLEKESGWVAKK